MGSQHVWEFTLDAQERAGKTIPKDETWTGTSTEQIEEGVETGIRLLTILMSLHSAMGYLKCPRLLAGGMIILFKIMILQKPQSS